MKGAIGNAFILNMVITFIIIFFMLLIGSVAYSKAYTTNKFLMDSLVDYVEYFNTTPKSSNPNKFYNQKDLCFSNCSKDIKITWSNRVNQYLANTGYILSSKDATCPKTKDNLYPNDTDYVLIRDTEIGDYDYCIYQKRFYELNATDEYFTKRRYSYMVVSYMKFDFPIVGEFIKLPIVSESKVIVNFQDLD